MKSRGGHAFLPARDKLPLMPHEFRQLAQDGLWSNNPGLVQLLGLCPLLAISNTAINGLAMGLASLLVLTASSTAVSVTRRWTRPEIRLPVYVLQIATLVTMLELLMNAYLHSLYLALGIFIPIITTNCLILGRAEAYASKSTVARAAFDGLLQGAGFAVVLLVLGALREVLSQGRLFGGAEMLFGETGARLTWVFSERGGLLLAALPPGAFIGLGLLIAGKNAIDARRRQRQTADAARLDAQAA